MTSLRCHDCGRINMKAGQYVPKDAAVGTMVETVYTCPCGASYRVTVRKETRKHS